MVTAHKSLIIDRYAVSLFKSWKRSSEKFLEEIIKAVKAEISILLIVGGGIRSKFAIEKGLVQKQTYL